MLPWKAQVKAGVVLLPVLVVAVWVPLQAEPPQYAKVSWPLVVCTPTTRALVVGSVFSLTAPATPPKSGPVCTADHAPELPSVW